MSMFAETIDPEHEFRHAPDGTPDYNESTYYNFSDASSGVVGWVRVGIQPNRPAAQATSLLFLPGGRTVMSFERAVEVAPEVFEVGSLAIGIHEPHRLQRLTFRGAMSVFREPRELVEPGPALRAAPRADVVLELSSTAHGVSFGTSGTDPAHVLEETMALGHYEQFIRLDGAVRVGDREYAVHGGGLRDHSWGPRDWSGPLYHRWVTAVLEDGDAVMALEVGRRDGGVTLRGAMASHGATTEAGLDELSVDRTADGFCRGIHCELSTSGGRLRLTGTVRQPEQFVPLRHVTTAPDGTRATTRIGYSAYEFVTGDGRRGLGIVEMLDQMRGGQPHSESGGQPYSRTSSAHRMGES